MPGRCWWPVTAPLIGVLTAVLVAGCSTATGRASGGATAAAATTPGPTVVLARCGTARTAAGVPVEIEVERGHVGCRTALTLERDYARELASGKVPGNGGGAPVTIRGWVCQGFNTPAVLATGNASACHKGTTEILAVLPPATPVPSPS